MKFVQLLLGPGDVVAAVQQRGEFGVVAPVEAIRA